MLGTYVTLAKWRTNEEHALMYETALAEVQAVVNADLHSMNVDHRFEWGQLDALLVDWSAAQSKGVYRWV